MENRIEGKFKCTNCGKRFRDEYNLKQHKNKKIPCLIINVPDTVKENPNRCTFCNRICSTKYNLSVHYRTCKIKNGGIDIVYDKVKHQNDENKKLKDENERVNKENSELVKEMKEIKDIMLDLLKNQQTQTINNGVINNTNITNNVTYNNYLTPDLSHMINKENLIESPFYKLFAKHLVRTPIELITAIYFDPEHKENQSIELVNKREKKLNVVMDGRVTTTTFTTNDLYKFRDMLYNTALCLVKEVNPILSEPQKGVGKTIEHNIDNPKQIEADEKNIFVKFEDGKNII